MVILVMREKPDVKIKNTLVVPQQSYCRTESVSSLNEFEEVEGLGNPAFLSNFQICHDSIPFYQTNPY